MGIEVKVVGNINKPIYEIKEEIFEGMSSVCRCREQVPGGATISPITMHDTCIYYGKDDRRKCEMELCPLL